MRVTVGDLDYYVETSDGGTYTVVKPPVFDPDILKLMVDNRVEVKGQERSQQSIWQQLLVASFPILLFIAVFIFFMRQMQGGSGGRGGPMSFAKSNSLVFQVLTS